MRVAAKTVIKQILPYFVVTLYQNYMSRKAKTENHRDNHIEHEYIKDKYFTQNVYTPWVVDNEFSDIFSRVNNYTLKVSSCKKQPEP